MNNTFGMKLFCSDKRKSLLQVKTHLVSKAADRAGTGTVAFLNAMIQDMLKEIEILLHVGKLENARV